VKGGRLRRRRRRRTKRGRGISTSRPSSSSFCSGGTLCRKGFWPETRTWTGSGRACLRTVIEKEEEEGKDRESEANGRVEEDLAGQPLTARLAEDEEETEVASSARSKKEGRSGRSALLFRSNRLQNTDKGDHTTRYEGNPLGGK